MKRVLITGANSYIGLSVEKWLGKSEGQYAIDTIDMKDGKWKGQNFSGYDVIFHVAGIAHVDVGNVSDEKKHLYYKVNTELTVDVANKAKTEGVGQFIFMSSMIVYSGCKEKKITKDTIPVPLNFYGDSKWQAEQKLREIETKKFKVVILRPPMIYGKGSKGNYNELARLATKLPFFPYVKNERSMLYIDNLCQFIKLMIDNEEDGIYFPQNEEYTVTSEMVRQIAKANGHRILIIHGFGWMVRLMMKLPGKIGELATKAFGDSTYDTKMSEYKVNYRVNTFEKSIEQTES